MAQDQVEEIKRKTDIVELISEYVKLARSGRNFKALCPFHSEKTPSFMVSPEMGIFKCFGCNLGGDAYRFLQEYEKIDFPQALKILADRTGVKLKPFRGQRGFAEKEELYRANYLTSELYHYLLTSHGLGRQARDYLKKRGVNRESIEVFRLGFAPDRADAVFNFLKKKGYKPEVLEKAGLVSKRQGRFFDRFRSRLIFPLFDHFGNITGFAGRVLRDQGDLAKYINTPETPVYKKGKLLYGLNVTKQDIKDENAAVVVEGELDAISSWQANVRNVVAVKGSAFTEDQLSLVSRFCQEIRLATDADLAGDQAARRAINQAVSQGLAVKVVRLDGYKDPDEAAQKDPKKWEEFIKKAQDVYDFLIDSTFAKYDEASTEGKARISRELTPVLSGIEDDIVRAHLLKKVASRLGVPEEAVYSQMGKAGKVQAGAKTPAQQPQRRGRREILEEYILALLFQHSVDSLSDKELRSLFKSPACSKLLGAWESLQKAKGSLDKGFDPSEFADSLPGELVDVFARIILVELPESLEESGVLEKEIEKAKRGLQALNLKEELASLTGQIRKIEPEGKRRQMEKLEHKFAKVSAELVSLGEEPVTDRS